MKLEVNVSKLKFFAILGVILIFAGAIAVYAYKSTFSGSNPSVFGHSADEVNVKLDNGNIAVVQDLLKGCISGSCADSGSSASSFPRVIYIASSNSWQVPSGVTKIFVEVWGAGGGASSAGGGGGGGYAQGIVSVSAGETYTASVGAGGTGSTSTGAVGGGESYFSRDSSKLLRALGGGAPTYVPGAGGIAIIASEVVGSAITGSPGGVYSNLFGGKGGDSPNGGNGGPRGSGGVYCSPGLDGFAPGGGGGGTKGGSNYESCNYMGAGANGLIAIHW